MGSEETRELISTLVTLFPAALYSLGLMEGKKGRCMVVSGLVFHLLIMLGRGITLGTIPLTEKHDTISFMAFASALSYWYISRKADIKNLSLIALPLAAIIIVIAVFHEPINTVGPFLRTPWFYLHSSLFFFSYGVFGVSFCIGLSSLFGKEIEYENLQYRTALTGWVIYSISLVAGSIWFFIAYGTYWVWSPKELWTTLAWFHYGIYLHARMMKGLRGRPASAIGSLGYIILLFAYFGVGTLIPSPPTEF